MERHKSRILVVDDEKNLREVLRILLEGEGYQVDLAGDGTEGLALLNRDIFDLIITDIKMPGADGFQVLRKSQEVSPETLVIMTTAFGTTESAIEAMKLGAYDYIHKPFKIDEIRLVVRRALEKRKLRGEVSVLRDELETKYKLENVICKSPKMEELISALHKVAQSNASALITGESGTGKDLVARLLHELSRRKTNNFISMNCAAFPEGLLESELFGHMRGAFTGAVENKPGLFEVANGGTLFLDEIGEMPVSLQAKLLRVLENGVLRRVGGTSDIPFDVRIVAATNKDLPEEIAATRFREDLFYRLNVIHLHIPPLRERKEDIPLLINHFLKKFVAAKKIAPNAMNLLIEHPWKGNVRELENVIERILLMTADKEVITVEDLPRDLVRTSPGKSAVPDLTEEGIALETLLEELEKRYLLEALGMARGVKTDAAKLLQLSFRSFRHRLHKYGIK
ncbi:MAG TPA: sigma-54 dependent transcriptional regulator [Thermodesulfovibrionales bacterium]|nr:sigma-54 dependent transcriptional regulator [Thermodesulfovibrionales bacterium]